MRPHLTSVAVLMFLAPAAATVAREWTDSTGKYRVEADFVDVQGETVRLKRQDGKIVAVSISRLSTQDQRWVKQRTSRGEPSMKSSHRGSSPGTQALPAPEDTTRGGARQEVIDVQAPAVGAADARSTPQWPRLARDVAGPNPLRVTNPNRDSVKVALRCGANGKDFSVAAHDSTTVYVRDAGYDIYFQYSDDPDALYQGDSFTLSGHGAEIQLIKVVDGNYGIRRVK